MHPREAAVGPMWPQRLGGGKRTQIEPCRRCVGKDQSSSTIPKFLQFPRWAPRSKMVQDKGGWL